MFVSFNECRGLTGRRSASVNDITHCNKCLFSVSGFLLLFWNSMCKMVCVCVSMFVCVHD